MTVGVQLTGHKVCAGVAPDQLRWRQTLRTLISKLPALLTACRVLGKYWLHFTTPASLQLVSINTAGTCCSSTIAQKSAEVRGRGPWAAM